MGKKVKKAYGKKSKKNKSKKIKGTLDKKIRKSLKKDLDKAFEIKSLEKAREHCNHRTKKGEVNTMSIETFKQDQTEFLIPNLQSFVDVFGEENVEICKGCFTPIVNDITLINPEDLTKAAIIMEAMGAAIVLNSEKSKEIETYRTVVRDNQKTARFVAKKFRKVMGKSQPVVAKAAIRTGSGNAREI